MTVPQMLITIGAAAAATIATRALPYLAFREGRTPDVVRYLGRVLPGAVFALLVVYCLRNVDIAVGGGIPEAVGVLVAGGLYLWRRSMLVSIFAATAVYMVLVNAVF